MLQGKIALVTGASRGMGRAIALRMAQEGAMVAVHYGSNRDAADETVRRIELEGGSAFALGADFRVEGSIGALYEALDAELQARTGENRLDILVNNAGAALMSSIEETTEAAYDQVMAVNAKTPFFLIQHALPRLRNGGRIINTSSATTRIAIPDILAYSMSKGAINSLTLTLAKQLGQRGITVNAICPGFVETDMNAGMLQDPNMRQFGANFSVFGRWGQPEDIASIAAFLASPDGSWITGQCIDASGGSYL
ncbi:SDR family oxidoreductase [Brevibacillus brevis]|uniref:SDR family oxidoreductase n=1 Tax=Brevibacillus brevis TaxID=1393 RepID=A0ABY9TC84_BREBE|nr:SDR family oxidoreductase [Brevibacillus brevis]WNC17724.1 SDR family oxidoreductase [Brevibacillus brevis]